MSTWRSGASLAPSRTGRAERVSAAASPSSTGSWSRRLLGQNAVVLLISDGLDADAGDGLAFEAERLAKSCARLVWLNPLLRYSGFEARPAGIRALLPHVDDFLPVHNLETLTDLANALAEPPSARQRGPGVRELK